MSKENELMGVDSDELERFRAGRRVRPAVDIYDSKDEILLVADLPGVSSGDLAVRFDNQELSIEGHRTLAAGAGDESETVVYARTFRLPDGLETDKIEAKLSHGVLSVHLPRSEALKPRQIQVTPG